MRTAGTHRLVERIQPGWLVAATIPGGHILDDSDLDQWCEVRAIHDYASGRRELHFTDGTKANAWKGDELRCITNAETRLRREVMEP